MNKLTPSMLRRRAAYQRSLADVAGWYADVAAEARAWGQEPQELDEESLREEEELDRLLVQWLSGSEEKDCLAALERWTDFWKRHLGRV